MSSSTEPIAPETTLYGYATSPFVWKVNCYLHYKHIDFSFVDVNPLTSEQIRFTRQGQVPVLAIGNEWRLDARTQSHWLDEIFDGPCLYPSASQLQPMLKIDDWVTNRLIPSLFRQFVDWNRWNDGLRDGWRLAQIVHHGTPLPGHVRALWPIALRRTDFIKAYANKLDRTQSIHEMHVDLAHELVALLGDGPFLGQSPTPTLADLSAFPIVAGPHLLGLHHQTLLELDNRIQTWARRIAHDLPTNPLPCADRFIVQPL